MKGKVTIELEDFQALLKNEERLKAFKKDVDDAYKALQNVFTYLVTKGVDADSFIEGYNQTADEITLKKGEMGQILLVRK